MAPSDPSFPGWETIPFYFNNSFDVGQSHDLVPVPPHSEISYSDTHPPSSNLNTTWYLSVEHYYGSSTSEQAERGDEEEFIGCITVTYEQVATQTPENRRVSEIRRGIQSVDSKSI